MKLGRIALVIYIEEQKDTSVMTYCFETFYKNEYTKTLYVIFEELVPDSDKKILLGSDCIFYQMQHINEKSKL